MVLKQCVMRGGLPFTVEIPQYRSEVLDAMEEAGVALLVRRLRYTLKERLQRILALIF